jgi:type I restriction enzyme S subunit
MSEAVLDTTLVRCWKRRETLQRMPFDWEVTIPADWKIHRLKEVADARPSNVDKKSQEGERSVRLCNYVDVYKNDLITEAIDFMEATATDSQIEQFRIQAGDVVITKDSEAWDDIAVPAYVPKTIKNLVCGYHLTLIRPEAGVLDGAYLAHCIQAEGIADQFRVMANGITRYGIGTQGIRCAAIPIPPLSEQRAIAAFLDRETARINSLVAKKQRLIELLEEKRLAVIAHAVTQGLISDRSMKDSGIDWVGSIPQHWTVDSVGHRYEIRVGKMLDSAQITGAHLKPYLRVADVQWGEINTNDLPEMDFDRDAQEKFRLREGDLLVNEGGSYVGRSAIWRGELKECFYQKALHRLRPLNPCNDSSEFFFYLMHVATKRGVFVAGGNHNTIEHLPAASLRKYRFAFPPKDEQLHISKYLEERSSKLTALKSQVSKTIDRLQEYRTSLISAAVTGQIDVREEVQLDD